MKTLHAKSAAAVLLLALAACSDHGGDNAQAQVQTKFPGVESSGGGTSGEIIANTPKPKTDGSYAGGTPFHAGGADGTSGGTATAGAFRESGHGPSGDTAPPAAKPTASGQ
jgi:hypothetical protein